MRKSIISKGVENKKCNKFNLWSSYLYNQNIYIMKSTTTYPIQERGILTSSYKQEIRQNIQDLHRKSLSKIKSKILHKHDKIQTETGTILQVSFFAIVLVLSII